MTIKLISILVLLVPCLTGVNAQDDPAGKTYKALTRETCVEMTCGGCMLYTYRILNFNQDSVVVSYQVIASCSPKESENNYTHMYDNLTKTYKWRRMNHVITMEGFDDYGKLTLQDSRLTGKNNIEFKEEPE